MFNVTRSPRPNTWAGTNYRDAVVVEQLKKDFHGKCYLCEQKHFGDINVEHFVPHRGDNTLKLDWNNLYYACSRCNSIKSDDLDILLDCCNSQHQVHQLIQLTAPSISSNSIGVISTIAPEHKLYELTNNTVNLLNQCYNSDSTGIRGVSKASLLEKIHDELGYLFKLRFDLKKDFDRLLDEDKNKLILQIQKMTEPTYPFSGFWISHIQQDDFLRSLITIP